MFEGLAVENVEVDRHIRTGGNESPELWNLVVCAMWASVIASWDLEGVGYDCFNTNDLGARTDGGESPLLCRQRICSWLRCCDIPEAVD